MPQLLESGQGDEVDIKAKAILSLGRKYRFDHTCSLHHQANAKPKQGKMVYQFNAN